MVGSVQQIVLAQFLEIEESFVNSITMREHGGVNGTIPVGKFMKCLKQPIHILKQDKKCQPCLELQQVVC
jgi:hypothetical protein